MKDENKSLKKLKEEYFKESNKVKKWLKEIREEWEEEERREKERIEKNPELKRKYEEMERKEREREKKIKELENKLSKEDKDIRKIMLDIIDIKRSLLFTTVPVTRRGNIILNDDKKYLEEKNEKLIEMFKLLEDKYGLKGIRRMKKKAKEVLIYDKKRAKLAEEWELEIGEEDGGYDKYDSFIKTYESYLEDKNHILGYGHGRVIE